MKCIVCHKEIKNSYWGYTLIKDGTVDGDGVCKDCSNNLPLVEFKQKNRDSIKKLRERLVNAKDGVNSEETIKQYCKEKIDEGIHVSHIIEALENNPSEEELYKIWLGNSMNTPEPIKTKKQLLEALNINVPKI